MSRKVATLTTLTGLIFSIGFAVSLFLLPNSSALAQEGKLTNKKAHDAVWQFMNGAAEKLEVTGVLEVPQQNAAQADLVISNWHLSRPKNDPVTAYAFGPGGGSYTWSGRGKAIFSHYNDGRWILTTIATDTGTWNNLTIPVSPW